jgi:predicted PurR-regulated permease PerM
MPKQHAVSPVRKTLPAVIAVLSMTLFIGFAVLALGLNALFNRNVSVAQAASQSGSQLTTDQATIQDLQNAISQYQAREVQYQSELQQAADQISQINQQNQQYQQLVQALQNAGVIQIMPDGRVFVSHGTGFSSGSDNGGE